MMQHKNEIMHSNEIWYTKVKPVDVLLVALKICKNINKMYSNTEKTPSFQAYEENAQHLRVKTIFPQI